TPSTTPTGSTGPSIARASNTATRAAATSSARDSGPARTRARRTAGEPRRGSAASRAAARGTSAAGALMRAGASAAAAALSTAWAAAENRAISATAEPRAVAAADSRAAAGFPAGGAAASEAAVAVEVDADENRARAVPRRSECRLRCRCEDVHVSGRRGAGLGGCGAGRRFEGDACRSRPRRKGGHPVRPGRGRQARERFVAAYTEANKISRPNESLALLLVGKDEWIMPIPIVKDAAGWHFDVAEGKEEILNRRIGRNELHAIQAVQAYVDAQKEYYLRNPQNDKLLQYAQKFVSGRGKRDGLYFTVKAGERASPLGPLFDRLPAGEGSAGKRMPYHGYYYRILSGQGPDAPGGAYSYLAQGRMIGGFALVAWPAAYGN